jgi:hypothetical protein
MGTVTVDSNRASAQYSLCLLGTSNGVIKNGYSSYFSVSENVKVFENHSIGACTSSFVFYNLSKINVQNYDFCILDLCVNDGLWMKANHVDPNHWVDVITEACCRILSSGCLPIILILPAPELMSYSDNIVLLIKRVCRDLNIPFFDCYEVVKKIQEVGSGVGGSDSNFLNLFKDSIHIRDDFGVEISKLVDSCLVKIKNNLNKREAFICKDLIRHQVFSLGGQLGSKVHSRRTSRAGDVFSEVSQSDGELTVSIPKNAEIISVCIDLKASSGFLKVVGDGECEYKLTSSYYIDGWTDPAAGVLLAFRPLKKSVFSSDGKVRITITAKSNEMVDSTVCQALISSVVIRVGSYRMGVPLIFFGDINMIDSVEGSAFLSLVKFMDPLAGMTEVKVIEA